MQLHEEQTSFRPSASKPIQGKKKPAVILKNEERNKPRQPAVPVLVNRFISHHNGQGKCTRWRNGIEKDLRRTSYLKIFGRCWINISSKRSQNSRQWLSTVLKKKLSKPITWWEKIRQHTIRTDKVNGEQDIVFFFLNLVAVLGSCATNNAINTCDNQPLKAKWECPCSRCFLVDPGKTEGDLIPEDNTDHGNDQQIEWWDFYPAL